MTEQITNRPTFRDLYQYTKTADRSDVGMHRLWGDSEWWMHIYSTGTQVNICRQYPGEPLPTPVADFIFDHDEDTVTPVRVRNGCADYDNMYRNTIPMDTPIGGHGIGPSWSSCLGPIGSTVKEIFRDLLIPIVEDEKKKAV